VYPQFAFSQHWTFLACAVLRPRLTTASGTTASELAAGFEVGADAAKPALLVRAEATMVVVDPPASAR
jgi:hypothetical protein